MLSIVVPVYKVEKYLHQCIDSILCQSFRDFELILVDDGSPDGCPQICDEYAVQDPRVRAIHKPNGGLRSAIIEGVKASRGEYIGFVDSDDWIEPDMYQSLMDKVEEYDLDCAICGCREIYENEAGEVVKTEDVKVPFQEKLYAYEEMDELKKRLLPDFSGKNGMRTVRWDKVFKRDTIYDYAISADADIVYGEDSLVVFPALMACNRIYILEKRLYNYRKRVNAATTTFKDRYISDTWKLIDKYFEYEAIVGKDCLVATVFDICVRKVVMILRYVSKYKEKKRLIGIIIDNKRVKWMLKNIRGKKLSFKQKFWRTIMRFKLVSLASVLYGLKHRSN